MGRVLFRANTILSDFETVEKYNSLQYIKVKKVPRIEDDKKLERIKYYQRMLQDPHQMNRIWFSDEMGFNLREIREKIWTKENSFMEEELSNLKINVWAAVPSFGKTSLHLYEENLNGDVYIRILEAHKDELTRADWRKYRFQQDNLSAHKTQDVLRWFE